MSSLMTGLLSAALDQTIVSTALKKIVEDLNGLNHYSWLVTAYLLTSTASTPLYGKILDLYGRRPVYQFSIIVFLLASFLSGVASSMDQLIAFRAIQGLGAGGLMGLTFVIVGDLVAPRERGKYQGMFGVVWGLSSVAGPLLGGAFGTAIFGTILNQQVNSNLKSGFADLASSNPDQLGNLDPSLLDSLQNNTEAITTLSPLLQTTVLESFAGAFQTILWVALPVVLIGFIFALFLKEKPLQSSAEHASARSDAAGDSMG